MACGMCCHVPAMCCMCGKAMFAMQRLAGQLLAMGMLAMSARFLRGGSTCVPHAGRGVRAPPLALSRLSEVSLPQRVLHKLLAVALGRRQAGCILWSR